MQTELIKELRALNSDKKMTQRGIDNVKYNMNKSLRGALGEDIKAVVNGERLVEQYKIEKIKFKWLSRLKKLFRFF